MAIVETAELSEGRSVSGEARQSFRYTRAFVVRTDSPSESLLTVANALGISFGDPHPDDASVFALKFDCQPSSASPLIFEVKIEYGSPSADEAAGGGGGGAGGGGAGGTAPDYSLPPGDVWSGGVSTATVGAMELPKFINGAKEPVANTAGVLFSDIAVEQARLTFTLARSYADLSFLPLLATNVNVCNDPGWSGLGQYTVLCRGARWERQSYSAFGTEIKYYRVTWEFEHNPDGWDLVLNSVGYQSLDSSGELVPIMNGETPPKPVSEPVALAADGSKAPAGTAPAKVTFHPYKAIDFATAFGVIS